MNLRIVLLAAPLAAVALAARTPAPVEMQAATTVAVPSSTATTRRTVRPTTTDTSRPAATTSTTRRPPTDEERYLSNIAARTTTVSADPDAVLGIGRAVCSALDAGIPVATVNRTVVESSPATVNGHDTGILVADAVIDLCPRHLPVMQAYVATLTD